MAEPAVDGEATTEPAYGLPAVWVDAGRRAELESRGMAVVDASSALTSHLMEVLRRRAWELLSVEETARMLDRLRRTAPRAADLISAPHWTLHRLRDLLQGMLREGLPVRDLERIAEAVHAADPRDPDDAMRRGRATGARELCERLLRQAGHGRRSLDAVWIGAEALEGDAATRAAERSVTAVARGPTPPARARGEAAPTERTECGVLASRAHTPDVVERFTAAMRHTPRAATIAERDALAVRPARAVVHTSTPCAVPVYASETYVSGRG